MSSQSVSSESSSSQSLFSHAESMRRHRQRTAQGQPTRHYATTTADRMDLLNTPYTSLDRNQRRRARRYAQELGLTPHPSDSSAVSTIDLSQRDTQAQQQEQLVASRFPIPAPTHTNPAPTIMTSNPSPSIMNPSLFINPYQYESTTTTAPLPSFIPVAMIPTPVSPSLFGPSMIT